jgi:cell division protein FtsB
MALRSRDEAIYRLNEAYISLRQKNEVIGRLQKDLAAQAQHAKDNSSFHGLPGSTPPAPSQQAILTQAALEAECQKLKLEVARLEALVAKLNGEIRVLTEEKAAEPLPAVEDNAVGFYA